MYKLIIFLRPFSKYLLVLWIVAIIAVSSVPSIPTLKIHTQRTDIRLDYLIHFLEYGSLALLAYLSFAGKDFSIKWIKYLIVTVCLVIFAFGDEYHQVMIPGRTFNPKDLISNLSGIAAGLMFCILAFRVISLRLRA